MTKIITLLLAIFMFVGIVGYTHAQTATPTPTMKPTSTTTVPAGAPSTGFGK